MLWIFLAGHVLFFRVQRVTSVWETCDAHNCLMSLVPDPVDNLTDSSGLYLSNLLQLHRINKTSQLILRGTIFPYVPHFSVLTNSSSWDLGLPEKRKTPELIPHRSNFTYLRRLSYLSLGLNRLSVKRKTIARIPRFTSIELLDNSYTRILRSSQRLTKRTSSDGRYFLLAAIILTFTMIVIFLVAFLVVRFKTFLEALLLPIFVRAFRPMRPEDYKIKVFIGYADEDVVYVRNILLKYLEGDLEQTTFVHHRDMLGGFSDQQFYDAISNSWRVLIVLSKNFLTSYGMSHIVMKYASHSVTAVNPHRVFVLLEEAQKGAIPDFLHGVLEDSFIIVLPNLQEQLTYQQKQMIKECLRNCKSDSALCDSGLSCLAVGYLVWQWVIFCGSGLSCVAVGYLVWQWVILCGSGLSYVTIGYLVTVSYIVWQWVILCDNRLSFVTVGYLVWQWVILCLFFFFCVLSPNGS